jgi:predicted nucleic acid-binding protein
MVTREWARLLERRNRSLFEDGLNATARVYGLVVVTRNVRDFESFEVHVLDPFPATQRNQD